MTALRIATLAFPLFLISACVRVGHIQQTEPVRTVSFTGSAKDVAQCVHQRVGGKTQQEGFGDSFVIYDSVKRSQDLLGFTHFAITVAQTNPGQGNASLRVMFPPTNRPSGPQQRPDNPVIASNELNTAGQKQFWAPVEECAASARRPA